MDEISEKLFHLYDNTPVLMAAYDGFERLRYANGAFRSAFFLDEGETPLWSDLMRRNFKAGKGTVVRDPDFETWLISTQSRRGKTGFRQFETDLADGRWLWMPETIQNDGWMLCIANVCGYCGGSIGRRRGRCPVARRHGFVLRKNRGPQSHPFGRLKIDSEVRHRLSLRRR